MPLDQDTAGPLGESLSLLWGTRPRRLIPATRARQLRDEDMSGRHPIHVYQSDLASQLAARVLFQVHAQRRNYE